MTDVNDDLDLESIWNETDDDGNVVKPAEGEEDVSSADLPDDEGDVDTDEETPPAEDESDEGESADDSAPVDEIDYKALYQKEKQRADTANGRLRAEAERIRVEREAMQARQQAAPAAAAEPTEEEQFLQKFREEYSDDVVKAVNMIAARQAAQVAEQMLHGRISPVEQQTQAIVEQAHFAAIEAAHPDVYDIDESPEFEAWLETRPPHVKGAYAYVRDRGTPAEVISMLNEYKAATQKQNTRTPPPEDKVNAALAVQRRRGTAPTAAEPVVTDEKALWDSIPE